MIIEILLPNGEEAICKVFTNQFGELVVSSTEGCDAEPGDMYQDDELGFTETVSITIKK